MDLLQLLILMVIAGLCGALAELVTGFSTGSLIVAIIVGIIGTSLGMWLASLLPWGLPLAIQVGDTKVDLLWGFFGSLLIVLLLEAMRLTFGNRTTRAL